MRWTLENQTKHIYSCIIKLKEIEEEKKRKATSCMDVFFSQKNILGFKEIYAIVFET